MAVLLCDKITSIKKRISVVLLSCLKILLNINKNNGESDLSAKIKPFIEECRLPKTLNIVLIKILHVFLNRRWKKNLIIKCYEIVRLLKQVCVWSQQSQTLNLDMLNKTYLYPTHLGAPLLPDKIDQNGSKLCKKVVRGGRRMNLGWRYMNQSNSNIEPSKKVQNFGKKTMLTYSPYPKFGDKPIIFTTDGFIIFRFIGF